MPVGGEGIPGICASVNELATGVCGGVGCLRKGVLGRAQGAIRLQGSKQGFNGLGVWVVSVREVMRFECQLNSGCGCSHVGFFGLGANE